MLHESTQSITCDHFTKQFTSNQDFSLSFQSKDIFGLFTCLIVCDGHGKGKIINHLKCKSFPWKKICRGSGNRIFKKINEEISHLSYLGDGLTISIVKIYPHLIKSYWIGDSRIVIFKDNQEIFKSKNHCLKNSREKKRIQLNKNYDIKKSKTIKPISEKDIKMQNIEYIKLEKQKILLTRALGHNNMLFPKYEQHTEPIDNHCDNINIIIASDGFWDMYLPKLDQMNLLKMNSFDLVTLAEKRWKNIWNYYGNNTTIPYQDIDDISVAVGEINFRD